VQLKEYALCVRYILNAKSENATSYYYYNDINELIWSKKGRCAIIKTMIATLKKQSTLVNYEKKEVRHEETIITSIMLITRTESLNKQVYKRI